MQEAREVMDIKAEVCVLMEATVKRWMPVGEQQ